MDEYSKYISITDVFDVYSVGVGTKVDAISIDHEKDVLSRRISEILKNRYPLENVVEKYGLDIKTTWEYDRALRSSFSAEKIVAYDYRPFDSRYVYYDKDFLSRNRSEVMDNFYKHANLGIELGRTSFCVFISTKISDEHFGGAKSYKFPLLIKTNKQIEIGSTSHYANIKNEIINKIGISAKPEEILYYSYAIFHCPTYRSRYAEQLKIDFPRLPMTKDKKLFADLVKKGKELASLHLLGKNPFDKSPTIFDDNSKWNVKIGGEKSENLDDWKVTEVRYDTANKRVYVNPGQYFEGVEKGVWEFMIGGYQVCEKWLKDRKKAERCLSTEDLKHYMKIVVSLRETIRVMGEIDKLITKWPME